MGHSSGDTQLVMSLILVVVGTALFLGGLASGEWVEDMQDNHTVFYGLWESCDQGDAPSSGCSAIQPASAEAYFEATSTIECLALVAYILTLCTCVVADDRDPAESCKVCVRRYIHVVVAFVAGGLTFLAILIFAACYKDDNWFTDPSLGYSYWLSLAGSLVTMAGGVMRIVFITWPDRPTLPIDRPAKHAPQAPGKRWAKLRADDALGADPLPIPLRPGDQMQQNRSKTKKRSGFQRFLGLFKRQKQKKWTVADISTVCDAIREKQAQDQTTAQGMFTSDDSQAPKGVLRSAIKLPNAKTRDDDDDNNDDEDAFDANSSDGKRKRNRNGRRLRAGRRVQIVEPFVGYNIPPTPGPDIPELEGSSSDDSASSEEGLREDRGHQKERVKRYQKVVEKEDLRARVVKTPPSVVYPEGHEEMKHYLTVRAFVDKSRVGSAASSSNA